MRSQQLLISLLLAATALSVSFVCAAGEKSPWWDKEFPIRIEVKVKFPHSLHTEHPVEVPIRWPQIAAKTPAIDWKDGRVVEVTPEGPKEIGRCQRSPVFDPGAKSLEEPSARPGPVEAGPSADSFHLVFLLPPQKVKGVRTFHLYFPGDAPDEEFRDEALPIRITEMQQKVRGKDPVPYHQVETALPAFSLRPGWNSIAGMHGFRPDQEFTFYRALRFYRVTYQKKTLSPPFAFRVLETGAVRALLEMSATDGSVPHRFHWYIYSNGDIHIRHRWVEGTDSLYWLLAEGAKIAYWQFDGQRFPQEQGKGFRGASARFAVLHSASGNSVTLLFDRQVSFNVAFSQTGRWESLLMRYRKVGLDEAFDDAEALCLWREAGDIFELGPVETVNSREDP